MCDLQQENLYRMCLGEAAYFVSKAIVIDPLRDTEIFAALLRAQCHNKIYIFETHFTQIYKRPS